MIHSTDDLSIFKLNKSNRKIDKNNLKRIVSSIKSKNLLNVRPILVNKDMEVIDGQHRLAACEELGIPISYQICDDFAEEEIVHLNQAQKSWTANDYINYWASLGKDAFICLDKLSKKFDMEPFEILMLVQTSGGGTYKSLKNGNISISKEQEDHLINILTLVNRVIDFISLKSLGVRTFLKSKSIRKSLFLIFETNIDIDIFIKKISYQIDKVQPRTTVRAYFDMFKSIYNFKNQNPIEND